MGASFRKRIKLIDRLGIFVGRCISSSMSLIGFVLLTMAVQHPILLWISWPLITSGGMASHMTNMPMARSIPLLSSAFQALTAGFISGAGGVPLIWEQMRKTLDYQTIFIIWLALGSTVTIAKIILFSPKRLQKKITGTEIRELKTVSSQLTDVDYQFSRSLTSHSTILSVQKLSTFTMLVLNIT